MIHRCSLLVVFIVIIFATSVYSLELPGDVEIHGFGSWAYGRTDGNDYTYGNEGGSYDNSQFHVNITAMPLEKFYVSSQFGWIQHIGGLDVEFDFAFAEYVFSDFIKFRLGKIKHPFGIYGEIIHVGTLRPFITLPLGIYGTSSLGYVGKGFNGAEITGLYYSDSDWGFSYDLYGGQLKRNQNLPYVVLFAYSEDPQYLMKGTYSYETVIDDMYGGRFVLFTPVEGLNFGISAYTGLKKPDANLLGTYGRDTIMGVHAEYLSNDIWFRSEFIDVDQEVNSELGPLSAEANGGYVELAYMFFNHLQVAGRYDWLESEFVNIDSDELPDFIIEHFKHRDICFGLNYWFNPKFAIKASYHLIKGFYFAFPDFDDATEFVMNDDFDNETNVILLGAQFSF